jgi:dTMP kinase
MPNITFLLDLDHETSVARMQSANRKPDRIERESSDFFQAVRNGYLSLAKENTERVVLLEASRPALEIAGVILQRVQSIGKNM